jgi:hypothetical protein
VLNQKEGNQRPGSHSIELDLSGLTKGVYFYTVKMSNGSSLTKRLVVAD